MLGCVEGTVGPNGSVSVEARAVYVGRTRGDICHLQPGLRSCDMSGRSRRTHAACRHRAQHGFANDKIPSPLAVVPSPSLCNPFKFHVPAAKMVLVYDTHGAGWNGRAELDTTTLPNFLLPNFLEKEREKEGPGGEVQGTRSSQPENWKKSPDPPPIPVTVLVPAIQPAHRKTVSLLASPL